MKRIRKFAIYLILLVLTFQDCSTKQQVDLIVHNAIVHTMDDSMNKVEAFAIKDGKIVWVGKSEEVLKKCFSENVLDCQQRSIYPGFYDAHAHLLGLGMLSQQADLLEAESYEQLISRLKQFQRKNPKKAWIIGRGWDQNLWKDKKFPTRKELDKAFPDVPVALWRVDGHAMLVNKKAIEFAQISANTQVVGGIIENKGGELTGILLDNAMELIRKVIPPPSKQELKDILLHAQEQCFLNGLTTVSDAGMDKATIDLIQEMHKDKSLKMRIYAMLNPTAENREHFLNKGILKTDRLHVRSFKFYADGALGSRGAMLLKPYSDMLSTSGFLLASPDSLRYWFKECYDKGYQANTHCIGDSANRLVLNLYGELLKEKNDKRWRIEHAQVVDSADVLKFGQFSVVPSVQPTHCTSDMKWAVERLGPVRSKNAYAYQFLMKQNGYLALGSDFPVEAANPIFGFHAATSRRDDEHEPEEGFQMENALSIQEALKGMTIWAAKANFEEKERGSIEIGKMADFIVLDTEIMETDFRLLRLTRVLNTYVAGEKVYSNYEAGY
jgi:predicted amidohydrolase YtcJ